jgi:ankyrin repeat protein
VNGQNAEGSTPLHVACQQGNVEVIQWLLERKADPNIANREGKTALAKASEQGKLLVVKLLMQYNADVNFQSDVSYFAIFVCVFVPHFITHSFSSIHRMVGLHL